MIKTKRYQSWTLDSSDHGLVADQQYGELKGKKIIKVVEERREEVSYIVFYEDESE